MASTINAAVGGIISSADASGELALQASGSTVATLTASGNVGIGTASPVQLLTVESTSNVRATIRNSTENTSYASSLDFATGTGSLSSGNVVSRVQALITQADPSALQGVLAFLTNSGDSVTEKMRIAPTGNLLVGTTTDVSGLTGVISDVNGNVRAIPQSGAAKTTSYTLVKGDVGEFINIGSGGSVVVPDSVFATGDVVSIFNNTSGNVTLTMSITTAYIGGTDADKATITLATRGIATILFISGTVCVVNGNVS